MIIVYLHQYFNTPDMSGGTRSYEMARRLVAMGHIVHIITSWREDDGRKKWFETEEAGIKIHWLPVAYSNTMNNAERIKAFFKFAFFSAKKAASIKSDVVFATSTPLTIALPAVFCAKFKKIPMVFEVRDLWPELPIAMGALKNPIMKWAAERLEVWAYQNASAIVALSPGMRDGIVKTGFPKEKVAVIPNSADNEFFSVGKELGKNFRSKHKWLANRPLIVYTGTFGLINGVGYMIGIAKELINIAPEVRILLIGDGKEFSSIKLLAIKEGVFEKNLFIKDKISKKDVPALLSAATFSSALFIDKPEMRANSANKFFDSLAAGKPVIINYGGWMVDLINSNHCGLVTWGMSPLEAAIKISQMVKDDKWLEAAQRNAKALALKQFDRGILSYQLEEVLVGTTLSRKRTPFEITSKFYD